MSARPHTGGPAFPVPNMPLSNGMSYRQWLIGQALQGLLASGQTDPENYGDGIASVAVCLADKVLAEAGL